jgi:hypothetical protein
MGKSKEEEVLVNCSQCDKAAVLHLGNGVPLCVDHYATLSAATSEQQRFNMAMMNFQRDRINETFGLPPSQVRINIPNPVINSSPVTYNNINIDGSVVGTVNTAAQVARIDVAMESIKITGHSEATQAIKELTETIVKSNKVEKEEKEEAIEGLAFLAEQVALPSEQRQTSIIKMVLKKIPDAIGAAADLTTLWLAWAPTLTHLFFPIAK